MIQPNWVAYFALLAWPIFAIWLYHRLPVGRATLWTILGGYLLLPVRGEIKFNGVPAFDKSAIPNLAALLCCFLIARRFPKILRGFGIAELLIITLLIVPFITAMLNSDPIHIGITYIPGVGPYDALSAAVEEFIYIIPFFLARDFLRRPEDNTEILQVLSLAGIAYSLPVLFEIRMSPQLHYWLYGYMPTDFVQEVRDGGFRPVVFLGHGLLVSFFIMTTTAATAAFWRTETHSVRRFSPGSIVAYLSVILVLCKTASALIYGAILVPLIKWAGFRTQVRVACVFAVIALSYPLLRATNLIPENGILSLADSISPERAQSLRTRFENEDALLNRALQRPWFGWGRYGRSRVYNGWDGGDSSITDGHWIITMGSFGIIGFIAEFGLIGFSVFRAAAALRFTQNKLDAAFLCTLALLVGIQMIDLLPNSSISPWSWLLSGALLGRSEALRATASKQALGTLAAPQLLR